MELAIFLYIRRHIESISNDRYKVGIRYTTIAFCKHDTTPLSRTCTWLLYKSKFRWLPYINCIVYKHFLLGCKPPMESTAFIKVSGSYFMPAYTLHPILIGLLSGLGTKLPCPFILWPAMVAFSTIVICWIILRIPYADRAFKL